MPRRSAVASAVSAEILGIRREIRLQTSNIRYGSLTTFNILFKTSTTSSAAAQWTDRTAAGTLRIRHVKSLGLASLQLRKKSSRIHDNGGNVTATRCLCTKRNTDCKIFEKM